VPRRPPGNGRSGSPPATPPVNTDPGVRGASRPSPQARSTTQTLLPMKSILDPLWTSPVGASRRLALLLVVTLGAGSPGVFAQAAPAPSAAPAPARRTPAPAEVERAAPDTAAAEPETILLNPFVVDVDADRGYQARETLAGTRIRTDLADVGSSISVLTKEFLRDINGFNSETTLAYATNTEVGGARGNFSGGISVSTQNTNELNLFANPNGNTRVRGLTSADSTRNYFLSDVPWEGYTVTRVDLQRGPNAILFGLGSPAGVVNTTIHGAEFRNKGMGQVNIDQFGSRRYIFDYNREVIDGQLAARVTAVQNNQKFRQQPAFNDDIRYFGALSYKPDFLNRGDQKLEINGNIEKGSINSNRPRVIAPLDQISAWWAPVANGGLNRQTFNPLQTRSFTDANVPATFIPSLGGYRSASLVQTTADGSWGFGSINKLGARTPTGAIITAFNDPAPGPFPQSNSYGRVTLRNFQEWAAASRKPFADFGGYDPATMTDPSIFDFYNTLMDGPNKGEWSDWTVFDVSLSHTFFRDKLGYNLAAFKQNFDRGQFAALGWQNRVFIDINQNNLDGTPNPNVGRAFIEEELRDTNNTGTSDRDAIRAQIFATHDFGAGRTGWLGKLLGEHRITGSLSEENQQRDDRGIKGQNLDPAGLALFNPLEPWIEGGSNTIHSAFRYYLSGDLRSRASSAGAGVGNMAQPFILSRGGPTSVRYFDTTWIAPASVNPGDPWVSPDAGQSGTSLTQSANPANYRGWTTRQANVVTFFSDQTVNGMSARDYLTSNATLSEFNVESLMGVWQGYFWNKAIVGTYGFRKDEARSYIWATGLRAGNFRADTQGADLDPARYNLSNPRADVRLLDTETTNWSVVAHVNRLLGDRDFLPAKVSLYYNKGENFSPLAGRIDAFRQPLPPPAGETEEYSVLLATKDNRFSLRATKYETKVTNGSSSGSIGNMWALEQTLGFTANLVRDFRSGRQPWANYSSDTAAQTRLQNTILPAWFQFEKDLKARFPEYVNAWMGANTPFGTENNGNVSAAAPAGFSYTENSISEGYEFELTANPSENWRLAVNASKTEASRTEVPGVAFKSVAEFVDEKYIGSDVGLAPVWWAGNTFGGRNVGPYASFRPDWLKLKALNGQSTPEVRRWRANVVTSYDFRQGRLRGAGIGGGYRWEDKAIIDYAPTLLADGSNGINLNAPFYAPKNETFDMWMSYRRKLSDKVTWRIQLNINNVFGKNELVPVTASVDPLAVPATITSTTVVPMQGSAYLIREGRSWAISNTFEF
jgi:hypothetical protein